MKAAAGVLLGLLLGASAPASAEAPWSVMSFVASDGWEEDAETFRVLMAQALRDAGWSVAADGTTVPCDQVSCANGPRVVVGSLRKFGDRVLISALSVEDGQARTTAQIPVSSLNALDVGAKRVAAALATGVSAAATGELGTITELEAKPDTRKKGAEGASLSLGAVVPLDDGFGGLDGGFSFGLGYWFETRNFAIEPTLSVRFSSDREGERQFVSIPFEIGGYYIPGTGDISPFFGGGLGIQYMWEKRTVERDLGSVVQIRSSTEVDDDGFGLGVFGRAGVLFLRTYAVRMSFSGRYGVTFMEINGRDNPQAMMFELAVHF